MEKEIFLDGEHEHTLLIEKQKKKTIFTLFYSHGEQWNASVRGEVALKVEDDGNGLKAVGIRGGKLDYSKALYLTIILKEVHKDYKFEQSIKEEF